MAAGVEALGDVAQLPAVAGMKLPADAAAVAVAFVVVVNPPAVGTLAALSHASVPACMPAGPEHAAAAVAVSGDTGIEVADVAGHGGELRACRGLLEDCREADLACMQSHSAPVAPVSPVGDAEGVEEPESYDVDHCFVMVVASLLEVEGYDVDGGMALHWS